MTDWNPFEEAPPLETVRVFGVDLRRGDRVRLWPQKTADIFDLALAGKIAQIEAIEIDFDNRIHFAVVLDDDPGNDLGNLRQPGHRFFFSPRSGTARGRTQTSGGNFVTPTILVAGIGNIFLGDDAFGVEVVRRLAGRKIPAEVKVVDYGIRGFDLAFALMDDYGAIILIDAVPRGGAPGTLYTIEPDLDALEAASLAEVETHGMNPMKVLSMVKAMGGEPKRILLVGCEPSPMPEDEERMGLSEPVERSLDEAVDVIETLIKQLQGEHDERSIESHADHSGAGSCSYGNARH